MTTYRVRPGTLGDVEVIGRHRSAMFRDMGVPAADIDAVGASFREWLRDMMGSEMYRAWLVEHETDGVVAGGGLTVLPWPPGPLYPGGRIAFVYNVYTEPPHRRHGLGRLVMQAIHDWCRGAGIRSVGLNASTLGRPLYDSLGYQVSDSPMMFLGLE
jgi:GNAT superfamily N-acetyltransferase